MLSDATLGRLLLHELEIGLVGIGQIATAALLATAVAAGESVGQRAAARPGCGLSWESDRGRRCDHNGAIDHGVLDAKHSLFPLLRLDMLRASKRQSCRFIQLTTSWRNRRLVFHTS